jgi:probable phosphoglycerate mutase
VTELVLVRHGETEWNRIGRVQGLSDIPLNDTGREQARHAGRRLAAERWDAVASSPLLRAADTARIIAAELGLPEPELDAALVERNYGEAEGLTGPEIDARLGGVVRARESREQVVELAARHPAGRVLVVSHGGVIGSLVRDATRWAWPEHGSVIANGSDQRFEVADDRVRLVSFNGRPWSDDLLPPVESVRTTD